MVHLRRAKQRILIYKIMTTLTNNILMSRRKKLVPRDKFDRHMKRARINDIECRKTTFSQIIEKDMERRDRTSKIVSSCY